VSSALRIPRIDEAGALVRELLAGLPQRLAHTLKVGETAAVVADRAALRPRTAELATVAAYLHDIGYSPELRDSGFHPIDGARYLRAEGWTDIVPYVAHHSQAGLQARLLGLDMAEFAAIRGFVQDIVDYADVRTGPKGERLTPDERLAEILQRHAGDTSAQVVGRRRPVIARLVRRVERRCGGDPLR